MYDYTHGQSDSIERITHSLCTLEFENHRPLYDWFVDELGIYPQQIEFARLNLTYTVMSKRKLLRLVEEGHVRTAGTIRACRPLVGLRRRGYTPESIRAFCDGIGLAKRERDDRHGPLLEHAASGVDLNKRAPRVMGVLRPLKVVIENYPEGADGRARGDQQPGGSGHGFAAPVCFRSPACCTSSRTDFREDPPRKYFRLALRVARFGSATAYFITCTEVVKDPQSRRSRRAPLHLRSGDPGGARPRRPQGPGHDPLGVGAPRSPGDLPPLRITCSRRRIPRTCPRARTGAPASNPDSIETLEVGSEPSLAEMAAGEPFQLERQGYFCLDSKDSKGAGSS